ncbi:MAG: hypothetical protein GY699_06275, partial [Desulfobacteraceae bacterium]|nr:hypothetical protein [Desulfobacteraceae bacterium]
MQDRGKRIINGAVITFLVVTFCFMAFPITSSWALTTQIFKGTVIDVNDGENNPFGLSLDDSIFLTITFDAAQVTSSPGVSDSEDQLFLTDYTGWDFVINFGSYTFSQSDLIDDPTYSSFWFYEGAFDGLEMYHINDINGYLDVEIENFGAAGYIAADWGVAAPYYVEAQWDFTPVPIPSSLLLLAMGLLGVAGT